MKSIFAVIPAYNEGKNIKEVVEKTKKYVKNVVVVDDGSSDNTSNVAKESGVVVLRHIINLGKGAALKTGCDYASSKDADIIILLDADGQHDPEEIPNFLKTIEEADVVFGYRHLRENVPFILKLGNKVISLTTRVLFRIKIRDAQSGYRAFTSDAYREIRWETSDYAVENEMIANIGKKHLGYREIPIKTIYKENYKGTTIIDGIKIVTKMFWWRITR